MFRRLTTWLARRYAPQSATVRPHAAAVRLVGCGCGHPRCANPKVVLSVTVGGTTVGLLFETVEAADLGRALVRVAAVAEEHTAADLGG